MLPKSLDGNFSRLMIVAIDEILRNEAGNMSNGGHYNLIFF